ncbi:MAG: type II secretion system F family protein [Bacillota bacterium]
MNKARENACKLAREWGLYLKGGYPLVDALTYSLHKDLDKQIKVRLHQMIIDLENGLSPETAIQRFDKVLPDFFLVMFALGCGSGNLDVILEQLEEFYRWQIQERKEIIGKLYYPVLTMTVFLMMTLLIILVILPTFQTLYTSLNIELNRVSLILIYLGRFVSYHLKKIFVLLTAVGGTLIYLSKYRSDLFRNLIQRLPGCKKFAGQLALSRFLTGLALQLKAGMDINMSLQTAARLTGEPLYRNGAEEIIKDIGNGKGLVESLVKWIPVESGHISLLKAGERTGRLGESLEFLSQIHQDYLKNFVDRLNKLVEPISITVLALFTGILAYLLLNPIWQIFNSGLLL